MRFKADVYALRIGNVVSPEDYARFPEYLANPPMRKRNAWCYIDARDLGQIVHLCIEKDGLGFQVFNAVNDTITANEPTRAFLPSMRPERPSPASWKNSARHQHTRRSAICWASRSNMTGASM